MRLSRITDFIASAGAIPHLRREEASEDTAPDRVKFMPLGDSITEITCWRSYVQDQIVEVNLTMSQVDFVGSMSNNPRNCTTEASKFDTSHEGHSGWLAIDIANDHLEEWLRDVTPEVVHFMLGTNDVRKNRTTDDIMDAYTKMVGLMRQSNPEMKIIVDKVIPLESNPDAIDALNEMIPDWAKNLTTVGSPIEVVDCSSSAGFTMEMLRDGIHPNDEGDRLIAQQVGPVIIRAIEEVIAARVPKD